MKSNRYWFGFLSETEKKQFENNLKFDSYIDLESISFRDFIRRAFVWSSSNETYYYWRYISVRKHD